MHLLKFFICCLIVVSSSSLKSAHSQDIHEAFHSLLEEARQQSVQYKEKRRFTIPILSIGGCAAVGKSTFANQLQSIFCEEGISAEILRMDHFIKEDAIRHHYGTDWDYRHLDVESLHVSLLQIKQGQKLIQKPVMNQLTRERGAETLDLTSATLLIVEGIYALSAISSLDFLKYADISIYLQANEKSIKDWKWQRELKKIKPRTPDQFESHMECILLDFHLHIYPTRLDAHYVIYKDENHTYSLEEKKS